MTAPYLVVSDLHFNKWSAFSTTNPEGLNSRLVIALNELKRAANELLDRGGEIMFVAGDVFHVRGSIDPEVFNPVHAAFAEIAALGVKIHMIPGNHDLAGKDATELGNAIQTLSEIPNVYVYLAPIELVTQRVLMVPWQRNTATLKETIAKISAMLTGRANTDLIIHAGIDGVLTGVPDHGLSAAEVASWGFKRVFAGDYHNHKVMEGGKVVSIGALTHQTWSDLGSVAGHLFVYPDRIEHRASNAPSFIEVTADDMLDPELPLIVDRNYVRVRDMKLTDAEVSEVRNALTDMGAMGIVFHIAREVVTARDGKAAIKGSTLDESVGKFIDTMSIEDPDIARLVKQQSDDILKTVRAIEV